MVLERDIPSDYVRTLDGRASEKLPAKGVLGGLERGQRGRVKIAEREEEIVGEGLRLWGGV